MSLSRMNVLAEELFDNLMIWRFGAFSTGIAMNSLLPSETRRWLAPSSSMYPYNYIRPRWWGAAVA